MNDDGIFSFFYLRCYQLKNEYLNFNTRLLGLVYFREKMVKVFTFFKILFFYF